MGFSNNHEILPSPALCSTHTPPVCFPSLSASRQVLVRSVPSLAHSVASLAVYEQGEDRMALRLTVWSGCVYVCLALELEPGVMHRPIFDITHSTADEFKKETSQTLQEDQ